MVTSTNLGYLGSYFLKKNVFVTLQMNSLPHCVDFFYVCLSLGVMPDNWTNVNITAVFKQDNPGNFLMYYVSTLEKVLYPLT